MQTLKLNKERVEEYFATARERQAIFLKKKVGEPKPWTIDPIFQKWYFCNVHREDDKVTKWIHENVRKPLNNSGSLFWAITACRLFNRIETLEKLKTAGVFSNPVWDANLVRATLKDTYPIVGAAYVVRSPDNKNKLAGIIDIVSTIYKHIPTLLLHTSKGTTLQEMWEHFQTFPCIGSFMAYEIVSDLRHTSLLENAPDIYTWAAPGPGAYAGLSILTGQKIPYSKSHRNMAIAIMQKLLNTSTKKNFWPREWGEWEMRDVEHWLCEYSKYYRVKYENKTMKRKY